VACPVHTFPHRGTAVTHGRITFADQSRKNTSTIRQREALQKDGGFPRQDFRKTCSRAGRDQRECIFRAVRNKLVLGKFLYVENIIPMPMSEDELADVLTQVTSLCQLLADSDSLGLSGVPGGNVCNIMFDKMILPMHICNV
jgi:hypothetical protein